MASPLEQRPPRILTPLPHRPVSLDSLARVARQEEDRGGFLGRFLPKHRREGLLPLPEGASLSSSSPPQLLPLSPLQSIDLPHPASTDTEITAGRLNVGRDIRFTTSPAHNHIRDANSAASSAPLRQSEFWDNITIPFSAYIPAPRDNSPERRTPPSIQDWEQYSFEPVPVEEPVASTSRSPSPRQ